MCRPHLVEIIKRDVMRPNRGRLGSGMNDGVKTHLANQPEYCGTIADVLTFMMNEARVGLSEAVQVPTCISRRAEKLSAHVVIQTVNCAASTGKKRRLFPIQAISPAKPRALVLEPLKAAYPCRSSQASLPLCGMLHAS